MPDLPKYWALEPTDVLIPKLHERFCEFMDLLDETGLYDRVLRNLEMYHGTDRGPHSLQAGIRLSGPEDTNLDVNINAFRSAITLLKTYITSGKIEWDAIATDAGAPALAAAKKANSLLDAAIGDPFSGLEAALAQSVEDALILTAGYVWPYWDPTRGPPVAGDLQTGRIYRAGDFHFCNPTLTDVAYDYHVRTPLESAWHIVRRRINRFDLAALYPDLADQILTLVADTKIDKYDLSIDYGRKSEDTLWLYHFFLAPCPSAPSGRYVCYVAHIALKDERRLPEGHVPVHRIVPGQFLLTPFGYTPAFSCQAPQDLLNGVLSSIASNQDALGNNLIHVAPGEPIGRGNFSRGVKLITCDTAPKPLTLLNTPPEMFKSVETYLNLVDRLSGVNATAHGDAPPNVNSGAQAAFMEQRVQQAASDLVSAYDLLVCSVGTSILNIYRAHLKPGTGDDYASRQKTEEKRNIGAGPKAVQFGLTDLDAIDRVSIVRGNPALRTIAGRIRVGETLVQLGAADAEEFLTLIETGSLDALTRSRDGQLDLIHAENDAFLRGEQNHIALPTDNHALHIKLNSLPLTIPSIRNNPDMVQAIGAAILQHQQLLLRPEIQALQTLLYGPGGGAAPLPPQPQGSPPADTGAGQMQLKGGTPQPEGPPAPEGTA